MMERSFCVVFYYYGMRKPLEVDRIGLPVFWLIVAVDGSPTISPLLNPVVSIGLCGGNGLMKRFFLGWPASSRTGLAVGFFTVTAGLGASAAGLVVTGFKIEVTFAHDAENPMMMAVERSKAECRRFLIFIML